MADLLLHIYEPGNILLQLIKQKESGEKECKIIKDDILQTIGRLPEILIEAIKERVRQKKELYGHIN